MIFEHEFLDLPPLERVNINGKRHYAVNGVPFPSVTTVLSSEPQPQLEAWKLRVGEKEANRISTRSKHRGNGLHLMVEAYLKNEPPPADASFADQEAFAKIKPVIDKNLTTIYGIEQQVYSDAIGVAGTFDLCGKWNNHKSVIDWKTSLRPKKREWIDSYFKQESIYSQAIFERTGLFAPQLVTVIVNEETDVPQVFIENVSVWLPKAIEIVSSYYKKIAESR